MGAWLKCLRRWSGHERFGGAERVGFPLLHRTPRYVSKPTIFAGLRGHFRCLHILSPA